MEKKKTFITNIIYYGLIVVLLWAACKYILPVLIPFIIAFLIASLIRIPVKKLYGASEARNRMVSIATCILFYIFVFSILSVGVVKLYDTLSSFLSSIPSMYQDDIVPALNLIADVIEQKLASMDSGIAAEIDSMFQEHVNNVGEYIKTFSVNAIKAISGSLASIPGFIIKLIIMIISTFFCMLDYNKILILFIKLIPRGKEESVLNIARYFKNTIFIYLKSYTLLFLLTYLELTVGFSILKIPYAPLIALLIAVFDILPVLGVGGILMPWSVILFVLGNIPMGIGMLVLYLIITFIRNTAEPKLVGKQIGLHPLATLIFMYLGLRFLGFFGMFLFPVTLAVLVSMKNSKDKEAAEASGTACSTEPSVPSSHKAE